MQCQPGELQSRRRKKRSARQFSRSPVTGSRRSQHLLRNVLTLFTVGRSERNNDIDKKGETFKKSLLVRHDESSESRTNHRVNTRETGALFQKVNRRKNRISRGARERVFLTPGRVERGASTGRPVPRRPRPLFPLPLSHDPRVTRPRFIGLYRALALTFIHFFLGP